MKFLKETNNTFVLGIFLAVIGAVAAIILAYIANLTKEPIAKAKEAEINRALQNVLPEFDNNPGKNIYSTDAADKTGYKVVFYGAKKDGKLVGIAGKSKTESGYSGKIEAMVGLDINGKIRTVAVLEKSSKDEKKSSSAISAILITQQSETPGLGTVLCKRTNTVTLGSLLSDKKAVKTALPPNKYLDQFAGQAAPAMPWKVKKDGGSIIYKTGATVTSRAVTDVVYRITHTYMINKKTIDKKLTAGE